MTHAPPPPEARMSESADDRAWLEACAKYQRDAATNLRTVATDDKAQAEVRYHDTLAARFERIAGVFGEREAFERLVTGFARGIATNYDHDADPHRYGYAKSQCRVCKAEALLAELRSGGDRGAGA